MSHSRSGELDAALHERLKVCTPGESLSLIARCVGGLLAMAPGESRQVARGLFIDMIDQVVSEQTADRARKGRGS